MNSVPEKKASIDYSLILLTVVLIGGAALRLYAINYDLPYSYTVDEGLFFLSPTLRMLGNHSLNPHWFGAPATTLMYLLGAIYLSIFIVGRCLGIYGSFGDFLNLYNTDPSVFFLSGRILSSLFGVATIWLVFQIGKRVFDSTTGLIAAAAIAICALHICLSQLVRMDVQMVFLILVAFWYCLDILEKRDWKSYLVAGFTTGLAVVTKYPAAVFVLTIALSHLLTKPWQVSNNAKPWHLANHRKLFGSGAAFLVGTFLGSPYLYLNFHKALTDIKIEARAEHLSHTGEGLFRNILWYYSNPLPDALSIAGLLLAGIGLVLCVAFKDKRMWILVSFPLFFTVFISSLSLRWARWILPAIPFLSILLAFAISFLTKWIAQRININLAYVTTIIFLMLVLVPLLGASISHARLQASPHKSTFARQWIMEHIPTGSRILSEAYGPELPKSSFQIFAINKERHHLKEVAAGPGNYEPYGRIGDLADITEIQQKIEYIVICNAYERFLAERVKYPRQVAVYEKLMSEGELVYDSDSTQARSRGSRVRIYRVNFHQHSA